MRAHCTQAGIALAMFDPECGVQRPGYAARSVASEPYRSITIEYSRHLDRKAERTLLEYVQKITDCAWRTTPADVQHRAVLHGITVTVCYLAKAALQAYSAGVKPCGQLFRLEAQLTRTSRFALLQQCFDQHTCPQAAAEHSAGT
jgi:hypothetical protein